MVSFECNAIYVEDVKDRSNIPKDCNAMYVKEVEDRSNTPKGCNAMYVKDVEDRSNTPKGCNAVMLCDNIHQYHCHSTLFQQNQNIVTTDNHTISLDVTR